MPDIRPTRKLPPKGYILAVKQFAEYFRRSPDLLDSAAIRQFQLYRPHDRKLSPSTDGIRMLALRFFLPADPETTRQDNR